MFEARRNAAAFSASFSDEGPRGLLEWLPLATIEHERFQKSIGGVNVAQSRKMEEERAPRPDDRAMEIVDGIRKSGARGELQNTERFSAAEMMFQMRRS
jgi:hypothetical protein